MFLYHPVWLSNAPDISKYRGHVIRTTAPKLLVAYFFIFWRTTSLDCLMQCIHDQKKERIKLAFYVKVV